MGRIPEKYALLCLFFNKTCLFDFQIEILERKINMKIITKMTKFEEQQLYSCLLSNEGIKNNVGCDIPGGISWL